MRETKISQGATKSSELEFKIKVLLGIGDSLSPISSFSSRDEEEQECGLQPLSLFSLTLGADQLGRLQEPAFKRQLNWESSFHSLHHISSSTLLNVIVIIIIKSYHCIFYIGHWTLFNAFHRSVCPRKHDRARANSKKPVSECRMKTLQEYG